MFSKIVKRQDISVGDPFALKQKKLSIDENVPENDNENPENIILEAKKEAEKIMNEAKQEAERIINEAKMESESIKLDVEEEARNTGYEEGMLKATEENEQILYESNQIKNQAQEDYNNTLNNMEKDIINIIFHITKKILGFEVEKDNYIISLANNTISKTNSKKDIVINVSEGDYVYLVENLDKVKNSVDGLGEVKVEIDKSLKKGGLILDTSFGKIDGGVDTQFENVKKLFSDILSENI